VLPVHADSPYRCRIDVGIPREEPFNGAKLKVSIAAPDGTLLVDCDPPTLRAGKLEVEFSDRWEDPAPFIGYWPHDYPRNARLHLPPDLGLADR
jgi:hypothetical protein